MPTKNPRLSVTLTPELSSVLDRLSVLAGASKSSLVAELLTSSQPVFVRMIEVLEAAARMKAEAMAGSDDIAAGLLRAQQRVESQLGLALDELDSAFSPILKEAEKVVRRARGSAARAMARDGETGVPGGSTPVPVTRGLGGVKSPGIRTKGARRG